MKLIFLTLTSPLWFPFWGLWHLSRLMILAPIPMVRFAARCLRGTLVWAWNAYR